MRNATLRVILIIFISGVVGYYFGINKLTIKWENYKPLLHVANKQAPPQTNADFSLFWKTWGLLEDNYYDKSKLDTEKMLNGAISGMVQSLGDSYTIYLPRQQNTDFKQNLSGQFFGIGAELGLADKQVIVISPIDGSPAQRAGLKPEDAILKVDGVSTENWTLSQAVEKIRGPIGTEVILTIIHKNEKESLEIKVTRDVITVKSVEGRVESWKMENGKWKMEEKCDDCPKVAYIRLSQFGDQTNKEWVTLVNSLSLQIQDQDVKGLILDLRNNPGGYLTDAVFIASEFLKQGTPVVVEDNARGSTRTLSVTRKGLFLDIPLVILINKGSASASEIVSASVRDNNRAILVGESSFGKGTIQMAHDLGNGAGLHITIAKWLTPKKVWVNGQGLKPDIEVSLDPKDKTHDAQLERAVEELVK
jgi:carboxyl-terminal processing protease